MRNLFTRTELSRHISRLTVFIQIMGGVLLIGCTIENVPMTLDLNDARQLRPLDAYQKAINCKVSIESVRDDRLRKDDLGMVYIRPIYAPNIMSWLQQSLASLQASPRLEMEQGKVAVPQKTILLNASIKKLYVHPLPSSISANIVMSMIYVLNEQKDIARVYRGNSTGVSWTNSPESINEFINEALNVAIKDIGDDLIKLCDGQLTSSVQGG